MFRVKAGPRFVALLLFVASLAAPPICRAQSAEAAGLRLDLPFSPQVKEGCGSATIAMVLAWWSTHGHPLPEAAYSATAIHAEVYSKADNGTKPVAIEHYFQKSGFRTFAFPGTWRDLTEHLKQGRPLIVALRPAGARRQLHYVVISGISDTHILLHDPAAKPYVLLSREDFEAKWSASKHWTLLALPSL